MQFERAQHSTLLMLEVLSVWFFVDRQKPRGMSEEKWAKKMNEEPALICHRLLLHAWRMDTRTALATLSPSAAGTQQFEWHTALRQRLGTDGATGTGATGTGVADAAQYAPARADADSGLRYFSTEHGITHACFCVGAVEPYVTGTESFSRFAVPSSFSQVSNDRVVAVLGAEDLIDRIEYLLAGELPAAWRPM